MNVENTCRVTVVIPGRNCASTLESCLNSFCRLKDSGEIKEIIFVNDGSTDSSEEIATRLGAKVLSCPSLGAGAARNIGWRAASTKYIWFVDADCVVESNALKLLVETAEKLGAAAVGGSYSNGNAEFLVSRLIHKEMVARHRKLGNLSNFAITANLYCERELLKDVSGFDESLKLAQDLDFAYRIVARKAILGFEWTSRVAHFHESHMWRYLHKQARQGYWRMQLYRKHPSRMAGDRYSGLLDYVQPPLALMSVSLLCAGAVRPGLGLTSYSLVTLGSGGVSVAMLCLLQVPMASTLHEANQFESLAFVPFGALRAVARGIGMMVGIGHLIRKAN